MTFAGGQVTLVNRSVSKGMRRIVEEERVWKVHCKQELPNFSDDDRYAVLSQLPKLRYSVRGVLTPEIGTKEAARLEGVEAPEAPAERVRLAIPRTFREHYVAMVKKAAVEWAEASTS
eukprot:CAMPEP_0116865540 /NCGR_PEP_ID=MMETSP0418-20121206/25497_1 /TAXON_ID=1158023 /ORGANISM="Astrosyne radiata, Strain 13vi08-1A" /LENGTH=117 /DNA_ID=CAMNT_0004501009 /DNA_START=4 /DNA_END=353 /DNA_ORIENTATION=-